MATRFPLQLGYPAEPARPVTPKPCTRCNGSGTEPGAVMRAKVALIQEITDAGATVATGRLLDAADRYATACDNRITVLEGALAGLLARVTLDGPVKCDQVYARIDVTECDRYRAVLDGVT